MARLQDYNFSHDIELTNFKDSLRRIINFGKYATPLVTSLPDWAAQPGEEVIYRPSSGGTTSYRYLNSAWVSTWSITV